MMRMWGIAFAFLALFVQARRAHGETDCSSLSYYAYNAVKWQIQDSSALSGLGDLLIASFGYSAAVVDENFTGADDNNYNFQTTTEFLASLSNNSAGAVLTHGADGVIAVEYYNTPDAAEASAADQCLGFGDYAIAWVYVPSQADTAWTVAVLESYRDRKFNPPFPLGNPSR